MGLSLSHLILLLLIIFVLFGAGKLPRVMGDIGKGVRNLRDGMKGEDETKGKQEVLPPEKPEREKESR